MKFKISALILLLTPTLSYAFMCPTNFNQIDVGMTTDQITQQCGKPDDEKTVEVKPEGPQEWSYFVPQTVSMSNMNAANGTQKMTIDFDKDGKAVNISVNGIGVGSTQICGTTMIQLGDDRDAVKKACGNASYVDKKDSGDNSQPPSKKVTTYTYNTTPPVKLIFEDGVLMRRE